MSWRVPRYCYLHAARDIGVGSITPDATHVTADIAYLIDDRPSVQFSWSDDDTLHQIDFDLGTGFASVGATRITIENHDLAGQIYFYQDDAAGFPSAYTLLDHTAVAGTDIDEDFTKTQDERYLRLLIIPSGAWSIGQIRITKTVTPSVGPEPGWADELVPNVTQLPGGDSLQTDSDQRRYEFTYPQLGQATASDLTDIEAMIAAVSTYRPILVDPPYDTNAAVVMKIEQARVLANTLVPASATRTAAVTLSLLEYLG